MCACACVYANSVCPCTRAVSPAVYEFVNTKSHMLREDSSFEATSDRCFPFTRNISGEDCPAG